MFHSKTSPPRFNSPESYNKEIAKFGAKKENVFATMIRKFGVPDLEKLSKKYGF